MLRRMRDSHTGLLAARCFSWELVVFYSVVSNFMEIGTVVCAPCLIVLWSFTSFSLVSFCLRICWTENKSLTRNRFPGKVICDQIRLRHPCSVLMLKCWYALPSSVDMHCHQVLICTAIKCWYALPSSVDMHCHLRKVVKVMRGGWLLAGWGVSRYTMFWCQVGKMAKPTSHSLWCKVSRDLLIVAVRCTITDAWHLLDVIASIDSNHTSPGGFTHLMACPPSLGVAPGCRETDVTILRHRRCAQRERSEQTIHHCCKLWINSRYHWVYVKI